MLGNAPNVPSTTGTQTPSLVDSRVPWNQLKANVAMPPPPPQQRQQHSGVAPQGKRLAGRSSQTGGTRATAPTPQRISAVNNMHPHYRGAVPITRHGIQITVSRRGNTDKHRHAEGSGIGGEATGLRRSHNGGPSNINNNSITTRSPLSLYGDNVYHSFKVCGAPDCELCTKDASGRWRAAFLVHDEAWAKRHGSPVAGSTLGVTGTVAGGGVTPWRSLIQRSCEHCRMPFIPKRSADASREHGGLSASTGSVDELDVSESSSDRQGSGYQGSPRDGGVVVLEGSLAGGSAGSLSSTGSVVGAGEEGKIDRPLSPLVGVMSNRPSYASSSAESQQSPVSSSRSGSVGSMFADEDFEYEGFCSGDCKMSYMLSTPTAVRRRRAAAEARAAAANAARLGPQM